MAPTPQPKIDGNLFSDRVPWLILVACLTLTAIAAGVSIKNERTKRAYRFEASVDAVMDKFKDRIDSYLGVAWSVVGLYQANKLEVDEAQFRRFRLAADWGGRVDGLAGLAFHQKVSRDQLSAFEKEMESQKPAFEIAPQPTGSNDLVVLKQLELLSDQREKAVGFNSLEDPIRRDALERVDATGKATTTELVRLRSDTLSGVETPAMIIFAPIYHAGAEALPPEKRKHLTYGYASASFRVDRFLEGLKISKFEEPVGFRVSSTSKNGEQNVLMSTGEGRGFKLESRHVEIAGRAYDIEFWATSRSAYSFQTPLIALGGIGISGLLFALGLAQASEKRARLAALVAESQRAKDLQDMDDTKTAFFSNLSHELRTPLNGILGMSRLLTETELDIQQREYMDSISACGSSLLELINDVLDFSKLRAGKMSLQPSVIELKPVFDQALQVVAGPAKQKGLKLELDWDEALPMWVKLDETRLRQVLINLLGNAVKFTQQGSVLVRATADENEDNILLIFEVEDSGIGISEENLQKLFKPFSQIASEDFLHSDGGTGLGLHLCREILELQGGSITASSESGKGTVFRCRVPLATASPPEEQATGEDPTGAIGSLVILVVDDNAINRRILALELEKKGCAVDCAVDGRDAVSQASSVDYDLIIMDYSMPEMDGLEATRLIRDIRGEEPRIIGLTAFSEKEKHQACKEAGMNSVLTKPVDFGELMKFVEKTGEA